MLLGNNVYESGKAGVYGFKSGELVFKLNSAGENIIGGWTIESNRIKSDNAGEIYIYHNGGRFMTIGGEGNALISGRCDGGTGLSLYTQSSSGTAISITAQTGAKAISSYGNVELIARNTEVIRINGLCVNVRTLTSSGSAGSNDDFIKINTTADITVSLPTGSAYTGKIVYMKQISTGNYTVTGGIRRSDQRATDSSFQFTDNKMRGFIFDGSYWNEIFMSVR